MIFIIARLGKVLDLISCLGCVISLIFHEEATFAHRSYAVINVLCRSNE
jgi:hypothetical protein